MAVTRKHIKAMAAQCYGRMARMLDQADRLEARMPELSPRRLRPQDVSLLRRRAERHRKAYSRLQGIAV